MYVCMFVNATYVDEALSYQRTESTRVGIPGQDYYGSSSTHFVTQQSFEVAPHGSQDVIIEGPIRLKAPAGSLVVPAHLLAYNGRPHCNRIHRCYFTYIYIVSSSSSSSFPMQPLHLRTYSSYQTSIYEL